MNEDIEADELTVVYMLGSYDGAQKSRTELERLTKNLEDSTEIIKDRMEEIYALRIRNIKLKADRDGLREIIRWMLRYIKFSGAGDEKGNEKYLRILADHEKKIKEME